MQAVCRILRIPRAYDEGWLAHRIRSLRKARETVRAVLGALPSERVLVRCLRMAEWLRGSCCAEPLRRAVKWRGAAWEAGWAHSLWRRKPTRALRGWDARLDAWLSKMLEKNWIVSSVDIKGLAAGRKFVAQHSLGPSGRTSYESAVASQPSRNAAAADSRGREGLSDPAQPLEPTPVVRGQETRQAREARSSARRGVRWEEGGEAGREWGPRPQVGPWGPGRRAEMRSDQ